MTSLMPQPWKHPKLGTYYYRKVIPPHLREPLGRLMGNAAVIAARSFSCFEAVDGAARMARRNASIAWSMIASDKLGKDQSSPDGLILTASLLPHPRIFIANLSKGRRCSRSGWLPHRGGVAPISWPIVKLHQPRLAALGGSAARHVTAHAKRHSTAP